MGQIRASKVRRFRNALGFVTGVAALSAALGNHPNAAAVAQAGRLRQQISPQEQANCLPSGTARSARNSRTGALRFIGTAPGRPIAHPLRFQASGSAAAAARSYFSVCARLFGLQDGNAELNLVGTRRPDSRRSVVRFRQTHQGVPIVGGELIVHLDGSNNILALGGKTLPDVTIETTPSIPEATAREQALSTVAKAHGIDLNLLTSSTPELSIYDPKLLGPGTGATALVWRVEVTPLQTLPIREMVLVDALRGSVVLHFNQVETALRLRTYTALNQDTLPGNLVCDESTPSCAGGDAHAIGAHLSAADTYNFFLTNHGRDSTDNAGMTITSTVHYNESAGVPLDNAFWDGSQMVYGDVSGWPLADDVVAHELTHGVTQHTSRLFSYYQSGAIDESLSDIWGEFVDLSNGRGNDAAGVRWLIGEDVTGMGAFRSMSNPTVFSNPDKMTSIYYDLGDGDNGGVHTNSGINNKAASLMVDGGVFNSQTVQGLGITKVAKIYYEVQTNLLTSGSDYGDLYEALYQGCNNLVGTAGISGADCQQVRNATNAVEMNQQPTAGFNPSVLACPLGKTPADLFFDGLESGLAKWQIGAIAGTSRWGSDSPSGAFAHTGSHSLYADDFPADFSDSYAQMATPVSMPAGAFLHFAHAFAFEAPDYDGGVVEYSANNGPWLDAGDLFDANGYPGEIRNTDGNPLGGRPGFVGISHGYVSSRLDLSSLAGQSVRFRWRMGLDEQVVNWGWWLDDVRIYTCVDQPTVTVSPASVSIGGVITATVANGPASLGDWVALAPTAAADSGYVAWLYLNDTKIPPTSGIAGATLHFIAPTTPGTYNVRLFTNGTTKVATSATVTVQPPPSPALAVSATTVNPGGSLTVDVTNGPANRTDWVAFFPAAAADSGYFAWAYLSDSHVLPASGMASATLHFAAPTTPGTYNIRLFNGSTKLATSATVTVQTLPTLTINDVSVTEGNGGTTTASFTVTLAPTSADTVTVNYATSNSTATTAGGDYVAASGTLTFTAGSATRTIAVTINGDATMESNETFFVNLSGAVGAPIGKAQGVGTIVTDDGPPPPAVTASPGSLTGGAPITVTIANGPSAPGDWVGLTPTAAPDSGYVAWSYLSATPAVGTPGATLHFTAPTTPGTYNVRFYTTGFTKVAESATVTVTPPPPPALAVSAATVNMSDSITVNVTNGPANQGDWVAFFPAGADDNGYFAWSYLSDSHVPPGSGMSSAALHFTAPATPGTFNFRLFAGGTKLATSPTVTVQSVPTLSINDVSVAEGNSGTTTATFTVTLAPASASAVTVDYTTANGSAATANSDYVTSSGVLTFPPGTPTRTIAVTVNGDTGIEPDETFVVNLSNATGAPVGKAQGIGTILSDDLPPAPVVSLLQTSMSPGGVITATVANGPAKPGDWVALTPTAAPDSGYVAWLYLSDTQLPPAVGISGATLHFIAPTTPGTYNLRLYTTGFAKIATSAVVTVTAPPSPALAVSAAALTAASITVSVTNGPANRSDWVGFFPSAAADSGYFAWVYLSDSATPPASGMTSATLHFTAPMTPGTYNFRLFNGVTKLATSGTITVTLAPGHVLFTASTDHDTLVESYLLEVFPIGANPDTAAAIAATGLGKPTPDASHEISLDQTSFFNLLPPGTYIVTAAAIGPGGIARSVPFPYTR